MEQQLSMFDTGAAYGDTKDGPSHYSFVREIGQKVRRWRTGEILEIAEIKPYYTYLSDGTVATPTDICKWDDRDRLITIPDDIWEKRCRLCVHRSSNLNWPFPVSCIDRPGERPCRIIRFFRSEKQGECINFMPNHDARGTCYSCKYNNQFFDGFCEKKNHAEQRRVYYAKDLGGDQKKRDYWGRHIQSVCNDYTAWECLNGDYIETGCF